MLCLYSLKVIKIFIKSVDQRISHTKIESTLIFYCILLLLTNPKMMTTDGLQFLIVFVCCSSSQNTMNYNRKNPVYKNIIVVTIWNIIVARFCTHIKPLNGSTIHNSQFFFLLFLFSLLYLSSNWTLILKCSFYFIGLYFIFEFIYFSSYKIIAFGTQINLD